MDRLIGRAYFQNRRMIHSYSVFRKLLKSSYSGIYVLREFVSRSTRNKFVRITFYLSS